MDIRNITWQETMPIRHRILWPHKPVEFCRVDGDESARHFGVYIDDDLISVASIYIDHHQARLRKFATLAEHQGKGVGSQLLMHILDELRKQGINYFWCDARETAIGFYQRFGMQTEGERFYKAEVPYFKLAMYL